MDKLPIEYIDGTNPPRFRWTQTVESPIGARRIEYEGLLVVSAEHAVAELCKLARYQAKIIESLTERVARQSDVLAERAEKQPKKR